MPSRVPRRPVFFVAALTLSSAAGCASSPQPEASAAKAPKGRVWTSTLSIDHALVGKIWDVAEAKMIPRATLEHQARNARYLLLGEKHDNPDHHHLQAELIRATGEGRQAVVFEMLPVSKQAAVDAQLKKAPADADALAAAVDWAGSGWPGWEIYRPVFVATLDAKLAVVAANIPRKQSMELARGNEKLPAEFVTKYALDSDLPEPLHRSLVDNLLEGHCGHMDESRLDPMIIVQRARDATMADHLMKSERAILIAGGGHARNDRGVPWYLQKHDTEGVISIGFLEVDDDLTQPEAYAGAIHADALPFDYVWFTPRAKDVDYCAQLEKMMKKMKKPTP